MTERPNKELALRYWNDPTLQAWYWSIHADRWAPTPSPTFVEYVTWHVGHEAPTEPPVKTCELAGIRFPMPMREAPVAGYCCWVPSPSQPESPDNFYWLNGALSLPWLVNGLCQATSDGAIQQGRAMAAALQQAIEGAK